MKPCEQSCHKCGNSDICRQHKLAGQTWYIDGAWSRSQKQPWVSEFLTFKHRDITAIRECIIHHCRVCGFDWETPVLADQPVEEVPDEIAWALHGPWLQKEIAKVMSPESAALAVIHRSGLAKMLLERRLKELVPVPLVAAGRGVNPTGEQSSPTEIEYTMASKMEGKVCGLATEVSFTEGALIVDLAAPDNRTEIGSSGPRLFINRAKDDQARSGWRILVHPDEGDPKQCIFVGDDGQVQSWTDAQEETHWPGSV